MCPPEDPGASPHPLADLYRQLRSYPGPSCGGCTLCCSTPWLLKEERGAFQGQYRVEGGIACLSLGERCPFVQPGGCGCYERRPLDCRLFPLDIIEEDSAETGESVYGWVVYDLCPQAQEVVARCEELLPVLERWLPTVFHQYRHQIAFFRSRYAPYAEGRFTRIRPVRLP